jgi:hypothetical protein
LGTPSAIHYAHQRTSADLAILKLADPLAAAGIGVAMLELQQHPIWPGDRFTVVGGGVAFKGLHQTGFNRVATLVAAGPSHRCVRQAGDNGRVPATPVHRIPDSDRRYKGDRRVSFAAGPNGTRGCGGITGATLLSPYRQWIQGTVSKLGGTSGTLSAPK